MEACRIDDDTAVRDLLDRGVDAERFYLSHDGTTTCGLHSAAFHNACRVLLTLLREGHCDTNVADGNGWTALHFAAGANSVEAIRLLLESGADETIEAGNGYTPLQWSERLQNADATATLREEGARRRLRRFELQRRWGGQYDLHRELLRRFFLSDVG
jgi:ankyrin repeat protein